MTRSYTLRTFALCLLALALLAGTASAQTIVAGTTTASFTYSTGAAAPAQQTSAISDSGSGDTFGAAVVYNPTGTNWLTLGCTSACAIPSSLTMNIAGAASGLAAGPYTATVTLTDSNDSSTTTIAVSLTVSILPIGASGGLSSGAPVTFSFTRGGTTASQHVTVEDAAVSTNTYTIGTPAYGTGATGWLTATGVTHVANGDTLTLGIVGAALANTAPGFYTATVLLTDSDSSTTTVYVKVTVASPLTASSPTTALSYSQTGSASQAAAQYVLTVSSSDTVTTDSYAVSTAGCPAWFSAAAAAGTASSTASDTVTMKITSAAASLTLPVTPNTSCVVTLKYQGVAFSTVTFSSLNVVAAALTSSSPSIALSYIKGGGGTNSQSTNITSGISAGVTFLANVATVPMWLTLTPSTGTANSTPTAVAFAVATAVTATMAVGNYTASVHFQATGYADLVVPVTLGLSNAGASLAMKEGASAATIAGIYTVGTAAPAPMVTPFSNDEPLPFTASCAVGVQNVSYTSTATSCQLNGAQATAGSPLTGVAYTWGSPMAISLDSTLFTLPVGTIVTVTVTVTPTGGAGSGTPMTLAYQYTTQMPAPTFATSNAVVPTSVAPQTVTGTSMVVLLSGTNFVGPQSIVGGAISPTLVYLAGSTTPVSQSQVTVISSTQLSLTIPQASFPAIASGKTTNTLSIGLANQTGTATPAAATATTSLLVTSAPVIYAIASTATYNNGGIGVPPALAPFELVSIFGDNFGYGSLTPNFNTSTLNTQQQVPGSLYIKGTGTSATFLSVTFKDKTTATAVSYAAPILFANQNQINAIVPSGLIVGHTVNVIVTSGAATNASDGLYTVTVIGNDPGIFTVASDGVGQGAILNINGTTGAATVNSSTNQASIGQTVAIYMTGLGVPDSTHPDVALATPDTTPFPTDCSAVSLTASATIPGYLQVGNTAKTSIAGWTAPTTPWTNIDGASIQGELLKLNILPPCMVDPITVTFGTGGSATTATVANSGVTWAGFAAGSVAGLYQINVTVPTGTTTGAAVPVTVTITPSSTGYTSQAGVTMGIH